jgi:hypothetical protein
MDKLERLGPLIEEATMDCYTLDEAMYGFLTVLEDNLRFPFTAKVVGEEVEVTGLDVEGGLIVVECRRKGKKYKVSLLSVEFNPKEVEGSEWIEAYRYWLNGH